MLNVTESDFSNPYLQPFSFSYQGSSLAEVLHFCVLKRMGELYKILLTRNLSGAQDNHCKMALTQLIVSEQAYSGDLSTAFKDCNPGY